jgi:hypothetical protein
LINFITSLPLCLLSIVISGSVLPLIALFAGIVIGFHQYSGHSIIIAIVHQPSLLLFFCFVLIVDGHHESNTIESIAEILHQHRNKEGVFESLFLILQQCLKEKEEHRTKPQVLSLIKDVWKSITFEQINKLVSSFDTRLNMVKSAGGCSIQPLICSHQTIVPADYFVNEQVIHRPFSRDEDIFILSKVEEIGNKWTIIGASLERDRNELKHSHNYLVRKELLKHTFDEMEVWTLALHLNEISNFQ